VLLRGGRGGREQTAAVKFGLLEAPMASSEFMEG